MQLKAKVMLCGFTTYPELQRQVCLHRLLIYSGSAAIMQSTAIQSNTEPYKYIHTSDQ